ncbi:GEVED domain-containing protein, partial [Winogradskyella sp.]|nr:GEVED domain-containing protein [Winogradskyella sp.]
TILTIDDSNHVVAGTCAAMMATVPAASLPSGSDVKLQIINTWAAGDYFFYVDNFVAQQELGCVSPIGTAAFASEDCLAGTFNVDFDITDLGDGGLFLFDGTTSTPIAAVGMFTLSYPIGTPVSFTLQHGTSAVCDVDLGTVSDTGLCPIFVDIDCSLNTPLNTTFCYGSSSDIRYVFTASGDSIITVDFLEGYFEDCCDDITIYDGGEITDAVLFASDTDFNNDATGISAVSTGNTVMVRMVSDGSVSCGEGSGSGIPLSFDVACLPAPTCPAPTAFTFSNITTTTVDLAWTAGDIETLWNIEVVDITAGGTVTGVATSTGVTNPYTLTGLNPENTYEVYVQADCGSGVSDWVGPESFFTGHCIPSSSSSATYTDSFTVTGGLTDTATTETGYTGTGYANYYDTNAVESFDGGAFDFSATIVGGTAGFAIWVDWNNDLVFDAATETVFNTTSYGSGPFTGTISVPSGTANGDYRLRTMVDYNDSNPDDNACAFGGTRGEVEDYKVTIVDAPVDEMDFNNVQWVTDGVNGSNVSLTVDFGTALDVYAQGYELGVTDAAGAGAGVECWIAINSENTDPSTWDSAVWQVATYDSDQGNNDEYKYSSASTLPGTYYVASRWRLNNAGFTYGAYNNTWDGTTNVSIELIVNPIANDDCSGAIALTPGAVFTENPIVGSNAGATGSGETPLPSCSSYDPADTTGFGGDVWYSVVVPADGNLTIEVDNNGGPSTDSGMQVYSGSCGSLVAVACDDDGGNGAFSQVVIESADGLAGETLLVRVFEYGGNSEMNFLISAFSATLSTTDLENQAAFTYFPNPVKNTLTLNAQNTIENVVMYNMLGQQVLRVMPNTIDSELDMSNLQTGTYFVKVTIANVTKTIRVIKQ